MAVTANTIMYPPATRRLVELLPHVACPTCGATVLFCPVRTEAGSVDDYFDTTLIPARPGTYFLARRVGEPAPPIYAYGWEEGIGLDVAIGAHVCPVAVARPAESSRIAHRTHRGTR